MVDCARNKRGGTEYLGNLTPTCLGPLFSLQCLTIALFWTEYLCMRQLLIVSTILFLIALSHPALKAGFALLKVACPLLIFQGKRVKTRKYRVSGSTG